MFEALPLDEEPFLRAVRPRRLRTFLTMSAYALGKTMGMEAANAELVRQVEEPDSFNALPGVRTLRRLMHVSEAQVFTDTGSSHVAKTRSRFFDAAWRSSAEAWISVDDDVEISMETALYLLQAVDDFEPRIVVVPIVLRRPESAEGPAVLGVRYPRVIIERHVGQGHLVCCEALAFGCVAMNRLAMAEIVAAAKRLGLEFVDVDGATKWAVFAEELLSGNWYGEDVAFFRRVPRTVSVEALLTGTSCHAGQILQLDRAHFALVP